MHFSPIAACSVPCTMCHACLVCPRLPVLRFTPRSLPRRGDAAARVKPSNTLKHADHRRARRGEAPAERQRTGDGACGQGETPTDSNPLNMDDTSSCAPLTPELNTGPRESLMRYLGLPTSFTGLHSELNNHGSCVRAPPIAAARPTPTECKRATRCRSCCTAERLTNGRII